MELYIQIRDGQPYEHPILGDNFREAFPHIDVNNLPLEFARFERLPNPEIATTYQVNVVSYQWENGVVKDVWSVREMTQEEKAQKTQEIVEFSLDIVKKDTNLLFELNSYVDLHLIITVTKSFDFGKSISGKWWEYDPCRLFLPFIAKEVR